MGRKYNSWERLSERIAGPLVNHAPQIANVGGKAITFAGGVSVGYGIASESPPYFVAGITVSLMGVLLEIGSDRVVNYKNISLEERAREK